MKRAGGALVAVPDGFLPPEELVEGNSAQGGLIGPSTSLELTAVLWEESLEVPIGIQTKVCLVDMDVELLTMLRNLEDQEDIAVVFVEDNPQAIPSPAELTAKTFAWLQEKGGQMEGDYTPEVTAESEGGVAVPLPKAKAKPKGMAEQMRIMTERQTQMEERMNMSSTSALLSRPLTQTAGFPQPGVSAMARELRSPPRTSTKTEDFFTREVKPLGVRGLEQDKPQLEEPPGDRARAVMAQSVALTTLVAQIASGSQDPMQDLTGAPAGSRGAQGRAQSELAQQRGSFFQSVVLQMARRMSPTSNPDLPYPQLGQWYHRSSLLRKIWRVWKMQRAGAHSAPAHDDAGLRDGRQQRSSSRCFGAADCHDRTGLPRSWQVRPGTAAGATRGPASGDLYESPVVPVVESPKFRTASRSKMGHGGVGVPEGTRRYLGEEGRDSRRSFRFRDWVRSKGPKGSKAQPQEEGRRPRKQEPRGGERLEGGFQCSEALDFLRRDAEFIDWAISLPRLVLKTRTRFAWHLLQTFSIETHGDAMITAALPLPAPFPGCFRGGGPGLSRRRLRTLAQKRLVHLLVLVIDWLYLGRCPSGEELRRSPNDVQKKIIEELYARVAASGYRSEAMSMVPGRSGSELIARLDELERFLDENLSFGGDYGGDVRQWLACSKKEADARAEEFPQLRLYRNLDVSRLKISGDGKWPLSDFLEGVLRLPYEEPKVLHHHLELKNVSVLPLRLRTDRSTYLLREGGTSLAFYVCICLRMERVVWYVSSTRTRAPSGIAR